MTIRQAKKQDLEKILSSDPAAVSKWAVKHTYTGYKALCIYRYAHWFWLHGMKHTALRLSYYAKVKTGADIHPSAKIGAGTFIDHGVGLVIGETAEIGSGCVLYQGVTLGGTGKECGKRHPTLGNGVMVSAGASVLGPVNIGDGCKIGAGSVVLKDVPPYCTVVGVPGRIVKQEGKRLQQMDQVKLPDPVMEEFVRINKRIENIENELSMHSCKYSLTVDNDNACATDGDLTDGNCDSDKQC